MATRSSPAIASADGPPTRRAYNSTHRQEMADATKQRIVMAGSELLHGSHVRDWEALTIRAVAERAAVNERTVYRHFGNERTLRDAVMQQLEAESGIELEGMQLGDVAGLAAQIFRHVSSFRLAPGLALDATLSQTRQRVHGALLEAVAGEAEGWSEQNRTMAGAMLDLLWSVGAYERLVRDWGLGSDQAIRAITWVITMVEDAVRAGRAPTAP
ncbi:MAG TPA: helix-turn-helix domain-containing protein [Acidimicrobiales bacterium]|nr:helix-turn-helix domain-containing protein [Acidimicrobiales bacterium]